MLVTMIPVKTLAKMLLILMMGPSDKAPYTMTLSKAPVLEKSVDDKVSLTQLPNGYYQLQCAGSNESIYFSQQQLIAITDFMNNDEYVAICHDGPDFSKLASFIVNNDLLYLGTIQLPDYSSSSSSNNSSSNTGGCTLWWGIKQRRPDNHARHMQTTIHRVSMPDIVQFKKDGSIGKLRTVRSRLLDMQKGWFKSNKNIELYMDEVDKSLVDLGYLPTKQLHVCRELLKKGKIQALEDRLGVVNTLLTDKTWGSNFRRNWYGPEHDLKIEKYYLDHMYDGEFAPLLRIIATGGKPEASLGVKKVKEEWSKLSATEKQFTEQKLGFHPIPIADYIASKRSDLTQIPEQTKDIAISPEVLDSIRADMNADLMLTPVQDQIIHILDNSPNMQVVGIKFNALADQVFEQWSKTEFYNPEIESAVYDSVRIISTTTNPHEFIVHVTMVEQILSELDAKIHNRPSWTQRTPQLLGRALCKFFMGLNPITQTIDGVMSLVHLGQFAATVTVGDWYLTADEYKTRLEGYAKTWDALSLENMQKLTAEQWVDIGAQMAANIFYGAGGVSKTIRYLKEIDTIAKTQRQAAQIARKMMHAIDEAIGKNPMVVTAEGLVMRMSDGIDKIGNSVKNITKNTEQFLQNNRQLSQEIIKRTPEILEYIKGSLNNLVHNSNKIKKIKDNVFNVSHTFAPDHVSKGILQIGQSAKEISMQFVNIIKKVDTLNLFKDGPNTIRTYINNIPVEIRVFIKEDTLISFNAFVVHSTRQVTNLIEI